MATYKVLQDIEAEDKFVGPLTLKQFIFLSIAAVCAYLGFIAIAKHVTWLLIVLGPFGGVMGILGFPWGRDQPTEVWLAAKVRFYFKPRRRIWDQTGIQDLVTITAPKKEERVFTNGLSATEVHSRLQALADTLDSRGWAIKNVNVNLYAQPGYGAEAAMVSDRLIDPSSLPQEVSGIDVQAADDIMDERSNPVAHQFDQLIKASDKSHRQRLLQRMKQATSPQAANPAAAAPQDNFWFMQPAPAAPSEPGYTTFAAQPAVPADDQATALSPVFAQPDSQTLSNEEQSLLEHIHAEQDQQQAQAGHMRVIDPATGKVAAAPDDSTANPPPANPSPATPDPAIIQLATNDDLDVATIARQANKATAPKEPPEDEVVISLH